MDREKGREKAQIYSNYTIQMSTMSFTVSNDSEKGQQYIKTYTHTHTHKFFIDVDNRRMDKFQAINSQFCYSDHPNYEIKTSHSTCVCIFLFHIHLKSFKYVEE